MKLLLTLTLALMPGFALAHGSFFDGFDRFDSSRWYVSDGWSNGSWMNCTWSRDAVRVADGVLRLGLRAEADGLICGEIQTRATFGYGTYEIAVRSGRGSGINAAFFTYIGPVHNRSHEEIDIELLLRDPNRVTFNTWSDGHEAQGGSARIWPLQAGEFRRLAFHWTPDSITWYVNDRIVHRAEAPLPDAGQKIYASLWSSDTLTAWMGPFDASALPMEFQIDYIAFTELGHGCQFPQSILCGETAP